MKSTVIVVCGVLCVVAALLWLLSRGNARRHELAVAAPNDDSSILAATQEAQRSLDQFTAALQHPATNQSNFQIKVAVGKGHLLWLNQVAFDSSFSGVLGPDATGLHAAGPGARITVVAAEVQDWMYEEDGRLVGGFTLRAIRDHLTGEARSAFERSIGLRFE